MAVHLSSLVSAWSLPSPCFGDWQHVPVHKKGDTDGHETPCEGTGAPPRGHLSEPLPAVLGCVQDAFKSQPLLWTWVFGHVLQ